MRPPIWIGDLLRALARLEPDAAAAESLARMLGLAGVPEPAATSARAPVVQPSSFGLDRATPAPADLPPAPGREAGDVPDQPSGAPIDIDLTLVRRGTGATPPDWAGWTAPVAAPPGDVLPGPATDPLIGPRVRRAILSGILATRVEEGPPDLDRLLADVTAGRPIRTLPRLPQETLRLGAQVLVDTWAGMAPYAADQEDLVAGLRDLFGPDRLEVLGFAGCPATGDGVGPGPRPEWGPWRPPPRGTPVLVLTDLGFGGPPLDPDRAGAADWRRFAARVRDAGCSLIALVPPGPGRWPRSLAGALTLVPWSERLTAGAVRRLARRSGRRR